MLPNGWVEASLSELAGPGGVVTDGDWVESKDQDPAGEVRLIQLADVGEGVFRNRSDRFMTHAAANRLDCTFLEPGDILIARMPDPLGRACIFPGLDQLAVTVVDVLVCRTDRRTALPEYLVRVINSPEVRQQISAEAGGTTRQRIAGGKLKALPLPLPPLAEQRRIVAKLDALTARLTRARAGLDRVSVLAKQLRLSALREVFHFDSDQLPAGWRNAPIGQIGNVQLGRQRSPKDHAGPHMRRYLRAANITWSGVDLTDVKEMNFSPAEFETFKLAKGDVLLNEGSGSASEVGKPCVWGGEIADVCFQNTLLRVRPHQYDPYLLRYALLYIALSGQFIANTQGVNIIHIGKAGLASFVVPVPPMEQQRALLESLDAIFAHADRLESEAARARTLLDRLESALLTRAFRGELVAQDPNDEPASVMLERLRTTAPATGKPRRGRPARSRQETTA